jgi:hypothetical protein
MQFCKGDAAEILYGCLKCSSVAFWGVCGTQGVTKDSPHKRTVFRVLLCNQEDFDKKDKFRAQKLLKTLSGG